MGLKELQEIKRKASEPKPPKYGSIAKKSEKKLAKEKEDFEILKADEEFYRKIFFERKHICTNCGKHVGDKFKKWFVHHILPKATYSQFRYEPLNVCILCLECHSKVETNIDFAPKIKQLREETEKLLLK